MFIPTKETIARIKTFYGKSLHDLKEIAAKQGFIIKDFRAPKKGDNVLCLNSCHSIHNIALDLIDLYLIVAKVSIPFSDDVYKNIISKYSPYTLKAISLHEILEKIDALGYKVVDWERSTGKTKWFGIDLSVWENMDVSSNRLIIQKNRPKQKSPEPKSEVLKNETSPLSEAQKLVKFLERVKAICPAVEPYVLKDVLVGLKGFTDDEILLVIDSAIKTFGGLDNIFLADILREVRETIKK